MIRPMNEWEITLGILCDACSLLATHCDSEMSGCPLFLCNAHAFRQAMTHGGTVRPNLWSDNPQLTYSTYGGAGNADQQGPRT